MHLQLYHDKYCGHFQIVQHSSSQWPFLKHGQRSVKSCEGSKTLPYQHAAYHRLTSLCTLCIDMCTQREIGDIGLGNRPYIYSQDIQLSTGQHDKPWSTSYTIGGQLKNQETWSFYSCCWHTCLPPPLVAVGEYGKGEENKREGVNK